MTVVANVTARNEVLAEELRAGSTTARDELIVINRPLILATVKRILRANPSCRHPKSDLVGIGLIALVEAVDRLIAKGGLNKPVRNYLITAIRNKVTSELHEQRDYYSHHQHVPTYDSLPEATLAAEDKQLMRMENTESFVRQCKTDLERQILSLYLEGYKPAEIAKTTGTSRKAIYKFLRRVRQKIQN